MQKEVPLITDICWTLYRSNTTFDFLDFAIRKKSYVFFRALFNHPISVFFNRVLFFLFHTDIKRHLAIKFLHSFNEQQIQDLAKRFKDEYLLPRKNDTAWKILENRQIVIATGTLDCIAKVVAEQVKPARIYSNQICKKRLLNDIPEFDILTDNHGDLSLVRKARKAYIVTYGDQSWWDKRIADINLTYIHVHGTKY